MVRDIALRAGLDGDLAGILALHKAAFGQTEEATLVRALLADDSARPLLSMVATETGVIKAHVLFTAVTVKTASSLKASILCPLAVLPEAQNSGLGTFVVEGGLTNLRLRGTQLVFTLGDPKYYGRFGFKPALPKGLRPPYELAEAYHDAWMVANLGDDTKEDISGEIVCANALMNKKYWTE